MSHAPSRLLGAFVTTLLLGTGAEAGKERPTPPELSVVGTVETFALVPDLDRATWNGAARVWREKVERKEASFVKLHFADVQLRSGDTLRLVADGGGIVEEVRGRGPKNRGSFWSLSAFGPGVELVLEFAEPYEARPPFTIDRVIFGNEKLRAPLPQSADAAPESICVPPDFEDVICYQSDAAKWANVLASVGVMSVGGDPDAALFCSGSNVSPDNYVLTNQHCVETQNECDNTEFVFRHFRTGCDDGSPPTQAWRSYRCDEIVAQSPFISCEQGLGDLDYTLASVLGDPAALFGAVEIDPEPVVSGEDIYIVQHPDGRPHEITHGGGPDVFVDGTVLRYKNTLDTEGGSSGSPIFRESDDRVVGLHHCGGCDTGFGNRGMLISDIYPAIADFVCTAEITLRSPGFQDLLEVEGNGDGVIDPGETWQLTPIARNSACDASATNVTGVVAVNPLSDGPISLAGEAVGFGDIEAGGTAVAEAPVLFTVDPSAPCGGEVLLDLLDLAADNGPPGADTTGFASNEIGSKPLATLFFEDFTDASDWTIEDGGTGTGPAATWTTANPGNRSLALTLPFMIADSDALGFGTEMDEGLISPAIDTDGFAEVLLQFTHDFTWYSGGQSEQADVEVRRSPSDPWTVVANFSGQTAIGTVTIDISTIAAGATELQIRFHYYDAHYEWWWAIDDVFVLGSDGYICNPLDTGPVLTLSNPICPGPLRLEISNLTPLGPVAVGIAPALTGAVVPNGPCAGTELDIAPPRVLNQTNADAAGNLDRDFDAAPRTCGGFVQVLDLTTCESSAPAQLAR